MIAPQHKQAKADEQFMCPAIEQAKIAEENGDVPIDEL